MANSKGTDPTARLTEISESSKKDIKKRAEKFSQRYYVGDNPNFNLTDWATEPEMVFDLEDKPLVKKALKKGIKALATMQEELYAQDQWSVLVIFQAMDAAGKDGAIKHVMSGVNPQGCQVSSFKAPSAEDLDHDFLWRCQKRLPERGRIGIFNRSYYEEVLVVRVHEKILQNQKIPKSLVGKDIWQQRFSDIRNFEDYLYRNGTKVIKIFLNISKDEQKRRFIDRVDDPDKNWKFSAADARERQYWDDYMKSYNDLIKNTSTKDSPWYVIPADNKPYARIAVASAIIHALSGLNLNYPDVSDEKKAELQEIKRALMDE